MLESDCRAVGYIFFSIVSQIGLTSRCIFITLSKNENLIKKHTHPLENNSFKSPAIDSETGSTTNIINSRVYLWLTANILSHFAIPTENLLVCSKKWANDLSNGYFRIIFTGAK